MAILKDFINQVDFPAVWELLSAGGGSILPYRQAYEDIFRDLSAALPGENTQGMTIRFVEEAPQWMFYFGGDEEEAEETEETEETEEDPETTLQVYGFVPGDPEGYAIGLKPPEVLVGLEVDPETAANYSPAEIVARCLSEMTYTATMASSAYGTEKDRAGGGLLASQLCMDEDIQNVDLEALREQLGAIPKPEEDYKKKYGFLF